VWHFRENEIVLGEITPPQGALIKKPRRNANLDGAGLKLLLLQQKNPMASQMLGA
jgi:hypothetical protein